MQQKLLLLIFTCLIISSCQQNEKSNSSINNNIIADSADETQNITSQKTDVYCNITFGKLTTSTNEYQFLSSNAMKKGTIITLFNMYLPDEIVEKTKLDIGFMMTQKTIDPTLQKGSYTITTLLNPDNIEAPFFTINDVISEQTYQHALKTGVLEDIQDEYVLLAEETNTLNILAIKNVEGAPENSAYYTHGKQQIQGNATVFLLKIATKEKLKLTLDFKVYHDWTLSK